MFGSWTDIFEQCLLPASRLRHFVIVVVRVWLVICSKSSTVSPSLRPSIIWSRIFFQAQSSEQNLHILTNSLKAIRKSLNVSPCCCTQRRKFLRSTISLMWPSTYHSMASIISWVSFSCPSVSPRFWTTAAVSCEKHNISAFTCLDYSSASPKRVQYDSHWIHHAVKSVSLSTYKSSFGKSPCWKV